ncbi:hypothetical protein [Streptomonospora salina]|uniref:Transposase n=1 Tax=Streptomonospora salina TaxID=104205 RepID=A0A841EG65_9ACTN|nr:hypothetical protein [Streptomonospora salina]MBB6000033.1 hypothetical protein [Streptomonospora salina]
MLARLAAAFPSIGLVWADAGYANRINSSLLNWAYEKFRLVVEIVRRPEGAQGFRVLPRRWVVEAHLWLAGAQSAPGRDYKRLTGNSETMVKIAMIRLMATRLAGQSARWSNRPANQAV